MTGGQEAPVLVTGGGGFLGSAIVRLLRAGGQAVRSLTRHRYPELDAARGRSVSGRRGRSRDRLEGGRGLCDSFPRGGQGGAMGPLSAVPQQQRGWHSERDRGLSRTRRAAFDLHQLPQCHLHWPRPRGSGRVGSLRQALRRGLSGDEGDRREAGPGEQRFDSCHRVTAPAPDLGAGRQQHPAADLCPGAGSSTLPDRPAQPAHRPDLHRQRRPGPSAGRRTPRAGLANHRPGLFHRPGPARSSSGTWSIGFSRWLIFPP